MPNLKRYYNIYLISYLPIQYIHPNMDDFKLAKLYSNRTYPKKKEEKEKGELFFKNYYFYF